MVAMRVGSPFLRADETDLDARRNIVPPRLGFGLDAGALGEELLPALAAGADDLEKSLQIAGDETRLIRLRILGAQPLLDPAHHRHRVAVVEAVALAPDLAVANDDLDAAMDGARDQGVGQPSPGVMQGAVPAAAEILAGRAPAQVIGAGRAVPEPARGIGNDAALG